MYKNKNWLNNKQINIICTQSIKTFHNDIHLFGAINCKKKGMYLFCKGHGCRETFEQTIFGKEEK